MTDSDMEPESRKEAEQQGVSMAQKFLTYCAAVLILVGAFCIVYAVILVAKFGANNDMMVALVEGGTNAFVAFFLTNSDAVVLLTAGLFASTLGSALMRKAISASAQTISDKDRALLEPLIRDGNSKALAEYVRLASLTGVTGFFTKLGFTGLPLATAGLGIFLILLATFKSGETATELMDLAKLVLGAFIGSFVQRKVESPASDVPQSSETEPKPK